MDLTLREFQHYAKGVQARGAEARTIALWAAWHTAAFSRTKHLPPLRQILQKMMPRRRKRDMTPEQMVEQIAAMTQALGGKDLRKKKGP